MLISAFPHYFLYALFKHHAVLHAVILLSFILFTSDPVNCDNGGSGYVAVKAVEYTTFQLDRILLYNLISIYCFYVLEYRSFLLYYLSCTSWHP